jgi:beta-phosphoglucomutase-like phosphatase (HAD superfamily)
MSLFDTVVGKIKSQREEKRYAQAYPKQYYEEKLAERKGLESKAKYESGAAAEKARIKELNKPKAVRAVQNYLKNVKAKQVKARIQTSSSPQGVFAQNQVNYNKEQESVFTRGQRDSPFKKL